MNRGRGRGGDEGVSAVEVVLLTPLFILFVLFIVAFGAIVERRGQAYGAARDAARAATEERDPNSARAEAGRVAAADLGKHCKNFDPAADVSFAGSDWRAGGFVVVQVSCTVDLSALSWAPVGLEKTVIGHSTSPLDCFRRFGAGPPAERCGG